MDSKQTGFSLQLVLACLLVFGIVGGTGYLVWSKRKPMPSSATSNPAEAGNKSSLAVSDKGGSQGKLDTVKIPAANGQQEEISIDANLIFFVSLVDNQHFFGKPSKINDQYLRLDEVMYYKNATTITRLGSELHEPEPVMYIQLSKVKSLRTLVKAEAAYEPVLTYDSQHPTQATQDASPSSIITDYLKKDRIQAFFFDNGQVFYAQPGSFNGTFLKGKPTFYLKTNSSGSINDISLTKVLGTEVDAYISSNILFWENMREDSQISKAIEQFKRANP